MGRRYYCDYCDRSFKDDPEARKKHLSGLQHAKNRADHYNLFKDPEEILKEESSKVPCKCFMTMGDCAFGHGCKYSHYTPPMIWELQRIVAMKKQTAIATGPERGWPNPEEILQEYFENDMSVSNADSLRIPKWNVPMELQNYPNLPPSLWPIVPERVSDSDFGKWGK